MGLFSKRKPNKPIRTNGPKKALLVGINYRGTSSALNGCINDVANVKEMLLKQGYKQEDIRVMTDDTTETPTKHKIMMGLTWLFDNKKGKDVSLFFQYSGHGSWVYDKSGDEVDGRDECLVPLDYQRNGMISDDDLKEFFQSKMTKTTKFTSLIDACHSGTIFDLAFNVTVDKIKKEGDKIKTNFNIQMQSYEMIPGKMCMLSGCEDKQTSADAWINRQGQGAMTYAFLSALRMGNYDLTYEQLLSNIYQVIKTGGYEQNPTMSSNRSVIFEDKFEL